MPSSAYREVERTYAVDATTPLPVLTSITGVSAVAPPVHLQLSATYFDTPALDLAGHRITLRRRTGGEDDGWHVKLPVSVQERTELHRPLGRANRNVPSTVLAPVRVYVRDRPVVPVATITTHRVVHRLLDAQASVLAEVCDDTVTAEALGDTPVRTRWREWEVELVGGDPTLLDDVQALLLAGGATVSRSPSKLVRALGSRVPAPPTVRQVSRRSCAGDAVLAAVGAQVERLLSDDPAVRADEPDAVHQMRVALRTLRSLLATYRPVLDRTATDPLRAELRWMGEVLGAARDTEVVLAHCSDLVAAQPPGLVLGPVGRRLDQTLAQRYRTAHRQVVGELSSTRWYRLLDGLDALLAEPPLTPLAGQPAGQVLPACVRKDWKRLRHKASAADTAGTPEQRVALLHEVRKAAKRLRYAATSAAPVRVKPAKHLAKAAKRVQTVLGEHQDAAVTRQLVRDVAAQADVAGESTFTYGRLDAQVQAQTGDTESSYERAWSRLDRPRLRRWLDV
jgi:CHAD domain-containing protein